jgi:hypothetical protein
VQAAAAARVAGGPDILDSASNGKGVSVLCHVIADADPSTSETESNAPPSSYAPHLIFIFLMHQFICFAFV